MPDRFIASAMDGKKAEVLGINEIQNN